MADKVGGVYIEIQAKMGSLERDLKAVQTKLDGVDKKGTKAKTSLASMGKVIASAGITGAVFALGKAALTAAAKMEQNRVAFTTMLGSAEKANKLLEEMTEFAAATPFELTEIVDASKKLIAFGTDAGDVRETLSSIGDVASGLNIPLGELTELYGKARVQQTLYAEDLNQLAGRGIPIFTEMGKVLNVDASEVKKLGSQGKISFEALEKVFKNLTKEGGQFGGLMAAQSQTLAGQWSNFNDALDQTAVQMGDLILPEAKAILTVLTSMVETYSEYLALTKDVQENQENYITLTEKAALGFTDINDKLITIYNQGGANADIALLYAQYIDGSVKLSDKHVKQIEKMLGLSRSLGDISFETSRNELDSWKQRGMIIESVSKSDSKSSKNEAARNARWRKLLSLARSFAEEVKSSANASSDTVVNINQELEAISGKYLENERLLSKRIIKEEQFNENLLNITATRLKKEAELEQALFDKKVGYAQSIISQSTALSGQLSQLVTMSASNETAIIDNQLQDKLNYIDESYNAEVEAVNDSLLTEEEKNTAIALLDEQKAKDDAKAQAAADKEKRRVAHDTAKIQKQISMFETIVTTPIAAMEAFKALAGIPIVGPALGAAAAAATTALGLKKLQLIKNQPLPALAEGGVIPAVSGGRQVTVAEAGSSEAVIPLNDATMNRLGSAIASAGGSGSQVVNVTLNIDGDKFYENIFQASKSGRLKIDNQAVI